jgi:hypothetical protein
MKPGRELDALIAEKVFGEPNPPKKVSGASEQTAWMLNGAYIPSWLPRPFSTQIADAWLVVETMKDKGWSCKIIYHEHDDCLCEFWGGIEGNPFWSEIVNHQSSIPLAICLAALKAVGDKE